MKCESDRIYYVLGLYWTPSVAIFVLPTLASRLKLVHVCVVGKSKQLCCVCGSKIVDMRTYVVCTLVLHMRTNFRLQKLRYY